jgi:hypothetical protein
MNELQHLAKPKDGPAPRWFHMAVAASMIISAVSALIATIHTGRTMSALVEQNAKLVRANSTPILEFDHFNVRNDGSSSLEFSVENVGTGAARIYWFELSIDGKPMQDMTAAIHSLSPDLKSMPAFSSGPVARRVFAAGAGQRFFAWPKPVPASADQVAAWKALDTARFKRIAVQACYCSVFDECWTSKLNGDVPTVTPLCKTEKHLSLLG